MSEPYYKDILPTIYCSDCLEGMRQLDADSVDLLCTDPPYGLSFMGKDWDKAVPSVDIWKECLRVLKPGAFAFVMCIPRQDCLSRMVVNLGDAGFETGFTSIYWAYASGFPKAQNIGKAVDKRLGAEREVIGAHPNPAGSKGNTFPLGQKCDLTISATPQAKALDGSFAGFQPKPAVEVVLVCMKPLSEKTYVDQALENKKGITWLDSGRIPYENEEDKEFRMSAVKQYEDKGMYGGNSYLESKTKMATGGGNPSGRFPANLLVSDDVLDDGRISRAGGDVTGQEPSKPASNVYGEYNRHTWQGHGDSGQFSRYFSLDQWAQRTFPFLIVPKASKAEKNRGLDSMAEGIVRRYGKRGQGGLPKQTPQDIIVEKNNHPTCKPIKLMSYLITLGSREGDMVLDPFMGSGSTLVAAKMLNRKSIGFDTYEPYCEIAAKRCEATIPQMVMEL